VRGVWQTSFERDVENRAPMSMLSGMISIDGGLHRGPVHGLILVGSRRHMRVAGRSSDRVVIA